MFGLVGISYRPRTFLLGFISSLPYTICITLFYPLDFKSLFHKESLLLMLYLDSYQPIIGTELPLMEWTVVAEKDYHHHLIRPDKRTRNMKAPRINSISHHMALLHDGNGWYRQKQQPVHYKKGLQNYEWS